jgi:hypothetical protein
MKPVASIEDPRVVELARRAEQFLAGLRWCRRVIEAELAWAAGDTLGVFRMRVDPAREDIADVVWVITGDLPPAYLTYEPHHTWQDAVRQYTDEMQRWVEAAKGGASVSHLLPVNVPPTPEYAARLESRLVFLRTHVLAVPAESLESDS